MLRDMGYFKDFAKALANNDPHRMDYRGNLGSVVLAEDKLFWNASDSAPVAGATAEFESGADRKRPTFTRVVTGAVIAGPAGAIVGGLFRKDKSRVYVLVTLADGRQVIADTSVKHEKQAREWAAKVNAAAAHFKG